MLKILQNSWIPNWHALTVQKNLIDLIYEAVMFSYYVMLQYARFV